MHRDSGMFNVANRAILVSFVGVDKTVTKEETVVHLHKTKRVKDNLIMDKIIIGDLLLDVKVVKIWRKESSINFWEDCMHKINVVRRTRYGCNSCKENHPSNECRQLDKIINMPNPVVNLQQQARDNMREARPQGGPPNELRQPNLYYDHDNARQTFYPSAGLQTANGYIPIQNRQGGPQNFENRRQALPTDPGLSDSQNVRFMDGVMESHHDDTLHFQMGIREEKSQWPPHTNAITYELRSLDDEVTHEAL